MINSTQVTNGKIKHVQKVFFSNLKSSIFMQYLLFVIFKSELYINNQNNKNQLYSNIIIN